MSKILEFLNEKIEGTEKKLFTTMSPEKLMEKSGLEKENFENEMKDLLSSNKVFYLKSLEEKIAWDGNYRLDEDLANRKWFTNKDKFNEVAKRDKEYQSKIKNIEEQKLTEKKEKVKNLSENAQKIFEAINTLTKDGKEKAYVSSKEVLKESKLNFEDMRAATKELSENKITYGIKISKTYEVENDGKKELVKDNTYVYTNSNSVLARVLKREEIKENIAKESNKEEEKNIKKEEKTAPKISKKKKTKEENER